MLTAAATIFWIALDVFVSVVTAPMMPSWAWWTILLGGVGLGALALVGDLCDRRSHAKEVAKLTEGQAEHSREHEILAQGSLRMLAAVTQTTGQPIDAVIEAANAKIARLEDKVSRQESIFWSPLTLDQRRRLTSQLIIAGKHSVRVTSHENTDCVEFARDLKDCFADAGWTVAPFPLTGTWLSAGASGLGVHFKTGAENFNQRHVFDEIVAAAGAAYGLTTDNPDQPDVSILVGTKRLRFD
jgi:hypothetical protein